VLFRSWTIGTTPTNVQVPGLYDLSLQGTYNTCTVCAVLCEGCAAGGTNCSQCYLARSGTAVVNSASRATTGSFNATLSNVRFDAWTLSSDMPVNGGGCLLVQSASIQASF
jgi:hypothetical protein